MGGPTIGRRLVTLTQSIVPHDSGNPQPVIAEDAPATGRLGFTMFGMIAPGNDRFLVAEEGQRQHLGGLGDALKALDRDETVNFFQFGPQSGGKIEIMALLII